MKRTPEKLQYFLCLFTLGVETEGSGGIESEPGNGSNYDSGAFSRTSSPADEIVAPPGPPPRLASAFRKALQHSQSHSDILSSSALFRQNLSRLNPNHASTAALIEEMRSSLTASMSRLALEHEPLNAPTLVMAAVNAGSQHHQHCNLDTCWNIGNSNCVQGCCEKTNSNIDPSLVLACLNAASESSSLQQSFRGESVDSGVVFQSPSRVRCLARNSSNIGATNGFIRASNIGSSNTGDVSVTVGANTMLTITNAGEKIASGLRRSRSGLPMLGTSGLMTIPMDNTSYNSLVDPPTHCSSLPKHGLKASTTPTKKRNRISTVYLQGSTQGKHTDQSLKGSGCETITKQLRQKSAGNTLVRLKEGLERSDSLVTIMGATICSSSTPDSSDQMHCNCDEKVTVNGQHLHCPSTKDGRHPLANCNQTHIYSNPPKPPPVDYPEENESVQYSPSIDLIEVTKERRPIRDEDEVFRFDPHFHSALANDFQHHQPLLVDRSTNTSTRITPVSVISSSDNQVVADDYAIGNNFSASNSEASQTQPNSLIII